MKSTYAVTKIYFCANIWRLFIHVWQYIVLKASCPCLRNFDFALRQPPSDAEDQTKKEAAREKEREKKAKKEEKKKAAKDKKDKKKKKKDKKEKKDKEEKKAAKDKKEIQNERETCCRFKHIGWSLPDIWSGTGGCASSRNHTGCIARRVGTFGPDEHFETHKKRTKVSFKNKSSLQWAEMYIDAKNQLVINQFHLSLHIHANTCKCLSPNIYIYIYIYNIYIYMCIYIHIKRYLSILL